MNEAYALQHPLEKLLDRHRLLALVRAPIAQRLAVLRQIEKLDGGLPVWEADIVELERARTGEIEIEARSAARHGDFGALRRLAEEFELGEWRHEAAASFVQKLKRLSEEVARRAAPPDPKGLAAELDAAFGAGDLPRCRALRQRWHEVAGRFQPIDGARRGRALGPGMSWLADQDSRDAQDAAYRRAVAALEQELDDDDADLEDIDAMNEEVAQFGRGVPEPLALRCRERAAADKAAAQKRDRLFIYLAFASVLVPVVAACLFAVLRYFLT